METYLEYGLNMRYHYDQDFKCIVSGEFCYTSVEEVKLYDANGNFFKNDYQYNRKFFKKSDYINSLGLKHTQHVCQIDFDFIKVNSPFYSNFNDLSLFNWSSINSKIEHVFEDYHIYKETNLMFASPVEFIGFNTKGYQVNRFIGKKVLDFNFKKYNENRLKAIKNKLAEEHFINFIFKQNLTMLSYYFMCSVDELKSSKFDVKKQIIKRLNYKISQKEIQSERYKTIN